jgi:hypothetical protein
MDFPFGQSGHSSIPSINVAQRRDALDLLRSLPAECSPLAFFDPQHRGVLDHLKFGNEGAGIKCCECGARPFPGFASDSPDARADFGLMKVGGQWLCSLCQDRRAMAVQSASEEARMTTLAFDPLAALKRVTEAGGFGPVVGAAVHPAAAMLPMMSDVEIDELAADIKQNGLIEPIVYWCDNTAQKESGQLWGLEYCPRYLLDGRARIKALRRLGWSLEDQHCRTKEPQNPIRLLPAWKREPRAGTWRYLDPPSRTRGRSAPE